MISAAAERVGQAWMDESQGRGLGTTSGFLNLHVLQQVLSYGPFRLPVPSPRASHLPVRQDVAGSPVTEADEEGTESFVPE